MIVRSFVVRKDTMPAIVARCTADSVAVIRPEKALEQLFRAAIRKSIVEKLPAEAEFRAITAYFEALDAPQFCQRALSDLSAYLSNGMYVQTRIESVEDYVLAKCARLCAEVVAIRTALPVIDGTELMICHQGAGRPYVDWTLSRRQIADRVSGHGVVIAGGYGRLESGYVVRIGRGGAHLMSSLVASAIGAERLECYIEQDGVAGKAALSYDEAAHYCAGEDVPFPSASLWPVKRDAIPIVVRNIRNDAFPGTLISAHGESGGPLSGVLGEADLSLITVYGTGLLGQVGLSSAVFAAMAQRGVNVRFISQSSSEYSLSFAVRSADRDAAVEAVSALVVSNPQMPQDDVMVFDRPVGIVTVFGDRMKHKPGTSAKVYQAVGSAGISIVAAAQGGEELSISLAVAEADLPRALDALEALEQ